MFRVFLCSFDYYQWNKCRECVNKLHEGFMYCFKKNNQTFNIKFNITELQMKYIKQQAFHAYTSATRKIGFKIPF